METRAIALSYSLPLESAGQAVNSPVWIQADIVGRFIFLRSVTEMDGAKRDVLDVLMPCATREVVAAVRDVMEGE